MIARYLTAIAKIDARTTIPAPQGAEAGPSTGEGPGTAKARG